MAFHSQEWKGEGRSSPRFGTGLSLCPEPAIQGLDRAVAEGLEQLEFAICFLIPFHFHLLSFLFLGSGWTGIHPAGRRS